MTNCVVDIQEFLGGSFGVSDSGRECVLSRVMKHSGVNQGSGVAVSGLYALWLEETAESILVTLTI